VVGSKTSAADADQLPVIRACSAETGHTACGSGCLDTRKALEKSSDRRC